MAIRLPMKEGTIACKLNRPRINLVIFIMQLQRRELPVWNSHYKVLEVCLASNSAVAPSVPKVREAFFTAEIHLSRSSSCLRGNPTNWQVSVLDWRTMGSWGDGYSDPATGHMMCGSLGQLGTPEELRRHCFLAKWVSGSCWARDGGLPELTERNTSWEWGDTTFNRGATIHMEQRVNQNGVTNI